MDKNTLENDRTDFPVNLKFYLTVAGIQTVLNIILSNVVSRKTEYVNAEAIFLSSLTTILVTFPLVSLTLGLLISLIPYRKISYRKKYFPSSLLIFFVLNGLLSLAIIAGLGKIIIDKILN